ncbi:hypothetical protein D3C80_2243080 [compost metagenome]
MQDIHAAILLIAIASHCRELALAADVRLERQRFATGFPNLVDGPLGRLQIAVDAEHPCPFARIQSC